MTPSRAYSDPDAIAQIADLALRSRRLAEGAISGLHRSPFHGQNIEFAAHREYAPGDDLRRLDWRVFARSDRHYIKQYEEESNVRVTFVVDASASMNYRGSGAALSKFDYAATLVVSLAMLLTRQQDPVGMILFDEEAGKSVPPSATQSQVTVIADLLRGCKPGRKTELGGLLRGLTDRIKRARAGRDRLRPVHRPRRRLRGPEPAPVPRPRGVDAPGPRPRRAGPALRRPDGLPRHRGG